MIELNSVIVILMAEALVALLLLVIGIWLWSRKKKSGDFVIARTLINELDESKTVRSEKLEELISQQGVVNPELQILLKEIDVRQKALYRQIIQLYLNHDPGLLKAVDETIQDLAQPYSAMLKHAGSPVPVSNLSPVIKEVEYDNGLDAAKQKIMRLSIENTALTEQLRLALKTLDEVSDEYSRVFNGNKSEAELQASYKRLVRVFQVIEGEVKKTEALL